jgi:hypothetical protein
MGAHNQRPRTAAGNGRRFYWRIRVPQHPLPAADPRDCSGFPLLKRPSSGMKCKPERVITRDNRERQVLWLRLLARKNDCPSTRLSHYSPASSPLRTRHAAKPASPTGQIFQLDRCPGTPTESRWRLVPAKKVRACMQFAACHLRILTTSFFGTARLGLNSREPVYLQQIECLTLGFLTMGMA